MLAIVNGKIYTMSSVDPQIDGGTILMDNGRITEIGRDIPVPSNAYVVDSAGAFVTPGLIDAHSHLGVYSQGYPDAEQDGNEMMSAITPHVRVIDSIYQNDEGFADAVSGGVTCVQILPGSANVICGQGAVVKTKSDIVDRMVVKAPSSMKAAFGENPKDTYQGSAKTHFTRMGNAALMREAFVQAINYREKRNSAFIKGEYAERDLVYEALLLVLDEGLPLAAHAHRADDIATVVRIAEEFDIAYTVEHCTEGHLIATWLAEKKVRAAVGPTLSDRGKLELRNKSWITPAALHEAGVHVCLTTDHGVIPIEHLKVCAALACSAGLPYMEALRAVTLNGAEHLGISDRTGSLVPGKDADIVVWSGDPLDARSAAKTVIIDGEIVRSV
ncbi:MAG: amidohydrolase [Synergistaceae bacterium]|nr:amidohydrolase [Synergistaceae bacterium]